MGLNDRKYMRQDSSPPALGGKFKNLPFTNIYITLCVLVYLIDSLTSGLLTKNLSFNNDKIYDFELWRLFTATVMFSENENMLSRIIGLVVLYLVGIGFERQLGKQNYINLYVAVFIGQALAGLLVPSGINYGFFTGLISAIFIAYGLILGPHKMTLRLYFLIPVKISGNMLVCFIVGLIFLLTLTELYPWQIALPILGGCLASYVFINKYSRGVSVDILGAVKSLIKPNKNKKKSPKMNKMQSQIKLVGADAPDENDDDYLKEKIDPILDKISESGMSSLSTKEKKILENFKKRMKK